MDTYVRCIPKTQLLINSRKTTKKQKQCAVKAQVQSPSAGVREGRQSQLLAAGAKEERERGQGEVMAGGRGCAELM